MYNVKLISSLIFVCLLSLPSQTQTQTPATTTPQNQIFIFSCKYLLQWKGTSCISDSIPRWSLPNCALRFRALASIGRRPGELLQLLERARSALQHNAFASKLQLIKLKDHHPLAKIKDHITGINNGTGRKQCSTHDSTPLLAR